MYFLNEEERRYVLRKLLPEARREGVAEELRGWNWNQAPLASPYRARLGVFEVAGQYCASGRDVYLRHVLKARAEASAAMLEGRILHDVAATIVLEAKRAIYRDGLNCVKALEGLAFTPARWSELARTPALCEKAESLWHFEQRRILVRVEEVLASQPRIGIDALAALALPVVVEQKLDGKFLGLSAHLSADAVGLAEPMMVDIKFGEPRDFHRLATTGYAMVMESLYEYPIGLGCIVYPRYREGRWTVERDFHIIGDELRQWFIEARDERARLVDEEIDPGTMDCREGCVYWKVCHPAGD
jgi:CRISPR-associated protein Csa1